MDVITDIMWGMLPFIPQAMRSARERERALSKVADIAGDRIGIDTALSIISICIAYL